MKTLWQLSSLLAISFPVFAETNYFCPSNNQSISLGMSMGQVISACGQPINKEKSQKPATKKVAVQQLIYNQAGSTKVFYGTWQISQGNDHGNSLVVNVIDNKVTSIQMDGSGNVKASSICEKQNSYFTDVGSGGSFAVGDPVSNVYSACGSPSNINRTFIEKRIPGVQNPEIWTYNFGQYQAPLKLKFQGGKLTEIQGGNE